MTSDSYDAIADRLAAYVVEYGAWNAGGDITDALHAAHEAGQVEMRERAACEAGDALAERGYHFGGVVARVRALPTSPETLAEAALRVGPPPDGVLAVGPVDDEEPAP